MAAWPCRGPIREGRGSILNGSMESVGYIILSNLFLMDRVNSVKKFTLRYLIYLT